MIRFMIAVSVATAAYAGPACPTTSALPAPHFEGPSPDQPQRIEPIGGYTLALLWMPQHCFRPVPGAESLACSKGAAPDFRLHGLWPDGRHGSWPQWCASAPILPPRLIARHYCATPSTQLLQHEWAKHGTCMPGMTPAAYFALSGRLFRAVRYPDMNALARRHLTAGTFASAFAAANTGMRASMVGLNLDEGGWLREIWLCFDTRFKNRRCETPVMASRPIRIRMPD